MSSDETDLTIGDLYIARSKNDIQIIPRHEISYVSGRDETNPALLVVAAVFLVVGLFFASQGQQLRQPATGAVVLALILGLAYFLTRRVGIVIASSGGKLFLATRGKDRKALLNRICDDLEEHSRTAPT